MKNLFLFAIFLTTNFLFAVDFSNVKGYWIIPDDDTGKPESVAYFYENEGKYYARMVLLYDDKTGEVSETIANPKELAKGIKGSPKLLGLDFIFNLSPNTDNSRLAGKVIDPDNGMVFDCEVWVDKKDGNLVVRGELLMFGKNEYWKAISQKDLPKDAHISEKNLKLNIPKK